MRVFENRFIPFWVAAFLGFAVSYGGISTRISKTGWENFPEELLDWFSILGAVGIFSFLLVLLFFYLKDENDLSHS